MLFDRFKSTVMLALTFLTLATVMTVPAHADSRADTQSFFAPPPATEFVDVPDGRQFYTEIQWLASNGVTTGWADSTFRPHHPVARDAMAAFMYRLAGSEDYTPPTQSPFIDVPTDYLFYKEISWLAERGISRGWDTPRGKEYRPQLAIARDAMAVFMYRYAGSPSFSPSGPSPFEDVSSAREFQLEIRWLAASGISTGWDVGYGCREYRPHANVARDAMAAFMYRSVNGGTTPLLYDSCSRPTPAPGPTVSGNVTPGAYCAKAQDGYYGYAAAGALMQCRTSSTDSRLRWREV